MRKPRSSNRSNLALHKQEYEHNLAQIAKIQARNEALAKVITEEENTEIVALIARLDALVRAPGPEIR